MPSCLDRLALVSKLLLDRQVLELRRENEALRLRLFWQDHCVENLLRLMRFANTNGPDCVCSACAHTRCLIPVFFLPGLDADQCTFKPWFERMLRSHGLEAAVLLTEPEHPIDAHILHIHPEIPGPWVHVAYGARLLSATSERDPELAKLSRLFKALHGKKES